MTAGTVLLRRQLRVQASSSCNSYRRTGPSPWQYKTVSSRSARHFGREECHLNGWQRPSMYVPSDGLGGISPERKASSQLRALFTFVAARVVLAQLEGSGRGELASYNQKACTDLKTLLYGTPIKDPDEWIAQLMRLNSSLALRVMEVRDAYTSEEFEWDILRKITVADTKAANTKLMRQFVAASLAASPGTESRTKPRTANAAGAPDADAPSPPSGSSSDDASSSTPPGPAGTPPAAGGL